MGSSEKYNGKHTHTHTLMRTLDSDLIDLGSIGGAGRQYREFKQFPQVVLL